MSHKTGAVDDLNAPKSMKNIVLEVMEYVERHKALGTTPTQFETYDRALHAVWPSLYKSDSKAYTLVAVSIYIEIAERWGFSEFVPAEIKELRL